MTPTETATILRQFNEWRRGDEDIPQFDPCKIGEAIDAAIEMIDRLEAAEKERDELRARIERMERQEPVAWLDDGTCRAGSASTALRVVTEATKQDMPASVAASFSVPLYAIPGAQHAPSVPEGWLSVPERLVDMFCGAADNLGDMPISEAWAERWSNEASDLLEKHNYFSKHAAPKPEGE